jgi:hypothetical protein
MSDHRGARLVLDALPPASALIADRGYDSSGFRQALTERGIEPCIPLQPQPQGSHPARQGALPPAAQDREHVR